MQKQVVDFRGEAVGALLPEAGAFRFMAVKFHVWALDGHMFQSLADARRAVVATLGKAPIVSMHEQRDEAA